MHQYVYWIPSLLWSWLLIKLSCSAHFDCLEMGNFLLTLLVPTEPIYSGDTLCMGAADLSCLQPVCGTSALVTCRIIRLDNLLSLLHLRS